MMFSQPHDVLQVLLPVLLLLSTTTGVSGEQDVVVQFVPCPQEVVDQASEDLSLDTGKPWTCRKQQLPGNPYEYTVVFCDHSLVPLRPLWCSGRTLNSTYFESDLQPAGDCESFHKRVLLCYDRQCDMAAAEHLCSMKEDDNNNDNAENIDNNNDNNDSDANQNDTNNDENSDNINDSDANQNDNIDENSDNDQNNDQSAQSAQQQQQQEDPSSGALCNSDNYYHAKFLFASIAGLVTVMMPYW